ncbi:MAG: NADH pyrophosphatase [Deltaproteobacteria bacterium ADurb.Bin058]|nr:MAG: NADH pyrophosphatase [Deltaproteobacteria bacterium ADurb.Bin058]
MRYPEQINLPYNRGALPLGFELLSGQVQDDADLAHWVILQGRHLVLAKSEGQPSLPVGQFPKGLTVLQGPLTFAYWRDMPVRCAQIGEADILPDSLVAEPFVSFQLRIPVELLTVAGVGKQLLHADLHTVFCHRCATPTTPMKGSWGKRCPNCGHENFPSIHACAIVCIHRENELLLIRKPEWPKGRFGLVAGFLDVGESLEECAIRETKEETGVDICNVRYVASQAWPFPSQLMVGFIADYAGGDIAIGDDEVEEAYWFPVDDLPILPSQTSIAGYLIEKVSQKLLGLGSKS